MIYCLKWFIWISDNLVLVPVLKGWRFIKCWEPVSQFCGRLHPYTWACEWECCSDLTFRGEFARKLMLSASAVWGYGGWLATLLSWLGAEPTWLILPVVICLSQRLSHACLSVNNSYETANGSLNQLSFIWWSLTTWITVVILELIHAQRPDSRRAVFIRFKADIFWWFIITFRTSCLYGGGDSFKFLPYQLSMVG